MEVFEQATVTNRQHCYYTTTNIGHPREITCVIAFVNIFQVYLNNYTIQSVSNAFNCYKCSIMCTICTYLRIWQ